jgi:hypothetical protein
MFWPWAARPAARTKSKRTSSKKRKDGRFENLVARYYHGVCTFASRLTDNPVEAVLLTHAAFTSARKLLRSRDEVRLVTILLTTVMRAAQVAKNYAERICSPRCPICLEAG